MVNDITDSIKNVSLRDKEFNILELTTHYIHENIVYVNKNSKFL